MFRFGSHFNSTDFGQTGSFCRERKDLRACIRTIALSAILQFILIYERGRERERRGREEGVGERDR